MNRVEPSISSAQFEQEAHIWQVRPESIRNREVLAGFRAVLSDEERNQCDRFRFAEDRHSYLVSHAMLRQVLSAHTGLEPADWLFTRSKHGRPEVGNSDIKGIRFNLTHTRGLAACIVTKDIACGIDAELPDAGRQITGIAQRMFSEEEQRLLGTMHGPEMSTAFFTRWVLREAFVKAKGIGISYPTRKLVFDIDDENTIRVSFDPDLNEDSGHWQFKLLELTDEHHVAVALEKGDKSDLRVVEHTFTPGYTRQTS